MAITVPLIPAKTHAMNEISLQSIEAESTDLSTILFEASSDGIIILNEQKEIIKVNPNALALFNYSENELLNQPFAALFSNAKNDSILPLPDDLFMGSNSSEEKRTQTVLAKKKNGEDLVVAMTSLSFEEDGTKRILLLFSDHQNYSMNELINRYASITSHEMKTPLTSILTSTYLLEKYIEAQSEVDKQKKHVEMIKLSAQQLNSIITDFLAKLNTEEDRANNS